MDTNDSNLKPQPTGGLKLMTVFVVVLVLHVLVLGGMTTYYLLKSPTSDPDLLADKTHKSLKATPDGTLISDGQMPDTSDKSATASTATPDASGNSSAPAPTPVSTTTSDETASTTPTTTDTSSAPAPTAPAPTTTASTTGDTSAPAPIPFRTDSSAPTVTPPDTTAPAPAPATSAVTASTTTSPAPATTPTLAPPATPTVVAPTTSSTTPTATASATEPTTAPITDGVPYVVKPHDSLAKIAHLNHTSVAKLKAANSLNSDLLHIGQKLMIPNKSTLAAGTVATTTAPTAAASATIPSASVPVASTTVAAATTTAPALSHNLYTVVKGDTLTKIAHKFKTTPSALMTANNITDPAKLSIGKKLKIPAKEARSAKNTEPAGTEPVQGPIKVSTAKTAQLANVEQ